MNATRTETSPESRPGRGLDAPALVTGGAGFIGSHLVERLLARGRPVVVIDDLSTGSLGNLKAVLGSPNLQVIVSKVSECPHLADWVARSGEVFHLAATVGVDLVVESPVRTIETNLRETEALFAAAVCRRTPILLVSTSEVYGRSPKSTFSEGDDLVIGPPHIGRWSYACSKLMDEFLALAYHRERGVPARLIRLFNIVGPRQTGRFGMVLPRFIQAALRNEPLRVYGDGHQTRCFCHVADTVDAMVRIAASTEAIGEVVNVGSDHPISIAELATEVVRLLDSRSTIEFIPYDRVYTSGFEDMLHRRPDLKKLESLVGFRPRTPLDEIIRQTADSLRDPPSAAADPAAS